MQGPSAIFALLLVGCTPIMPASSVPVNNITLNQRFYVDGAGASCTSGGEAHATVGAQGGTRLQGAAVANESVAAAAPGSTAISNDVWIAGTTARGAAEAANTVSPVVSAAVSAAGTGSPSTNQTTPAVPAAPTSPEHE